MGYTQSKYPYVKRYQSHGMMLIQFFLTCTEYFPFLGAIDDKSNWHAFIFSSREIHKFKRNRLK